MPLATLTAHLEDLLRQHGAVAVFAVMAVDAVLPVGGELTMLLAGALAAGALGPIGRDALSEYLLLALAGTTGYLAGSVAGWAVGRRGGRELVERRGRLLHLGPARFARAERWFARHGSTAVFLGRLTPLVRSFISIPAGVLGAPLASYTVLTAAGSAIWCFGFAGAGWAIGHRFEDLHRLLRYVDVAVVLGTVVVLGVLASRVRRARAQRVA
jgi:membrane protein DedA with SNARE-associated domain